MYLFGASGHGKVVKEILTARGEPVEAFVDDNPDVNEWSGRKVLHDAAGLSPMIVSIGLNQIRKKIVEGLTCEFGTAIHPSAIVSSSARIGEGTVVMAGAVINADVVIGKHCIVNTGASIDHDCSLGDYVHIAPKCAVSGGVTIGEGTWVGVGSCVKQCLKIGSWNMIGAGSVVVKDLPDGIVAYGNPCKVQHMNGQKSVKKGMPMSGERNRIYLCLAHMSGKEQQFIKEAFDTNWVVPLGPNVNAFEEDLKQFTGGGKEVVALASGTAAVHLALLACGVGPGDEVLVQSFTFCASSSIRSPQAGTWTPDCLRRLSKSVSPGRAGNRRRSSLLPYTACLTESTRLCRLPINTAFRSSKMPPKASVQNSTGVCSGRSANTAFCRSMAIR